MTARHQILKLLGRDITARGRPKCLAAIENAISSLVVGGRTESQFTENFGALSLALTGDEMTRLNDASRLPLIYPYWHQHNFALPRFGDADKALHDSYPDRHYVGEDPLI